MIRHLSKKGIKILITDHNAREIFSITKRCYLISDGSVLANGSAQELVNDPIVNKRGLETTFRSNHYFEIRSPISSSYDFEIAW
jgi:lipopolysaccharide export system ATP-binding protein